MTRSTKAAAAGLAGLGVGYALWRGWETGLDKMWRTALGSPDREAIDFAVFKRPNCRNDALVCPKDFCPEARPDFEPPVFMLPAERLRALLLEFAASRPDTEFVRSDAGQEHFVVRTRYLRFPDRLVAQVIERGPNRSSLALYARSQVGRTDFGVNRRRLARWVEGIGRLAAQETRRSSR